MTFLCVPIMVDSPAQAVADAIRAQTAGADLVEFRIDRFTQDPQQVAALVAESPLPCIVTCRPTWEGGEFDGEDQWRVAVLEHAALGTCKPAYLDLELAAWQRSANLRQKVALVVDHADQVRREVTSGLILSSHDFQGRPVDLHRRLMAMAETPACRVVKLAWRARSIRDNIEAFEILLRRLKPTIALCMGEEGLASRVLAGKFGALLTFAALDADKGTAPGQPTVAELRGLYRWDRITPQTRVFGVIGHPVGHSKSPLIHNAGFDATGFDGVYLPMPIAPAYEAFKASVFSWLDLPELHFQGASVTIPHKENLLRFVREQGGVIEPLAEVIGAANTLHRRPDGSLYASNTDYGAALDAVCDSLGIDRSGLRGRRVAVLGAGGAARAVVAGFACHGAHVTIHNRTEAKARQIAESLAGPVADAGGSVAVASLDDLAFSAAEVFINVTPLGMYPQVEQTPLPQPPAGWGPGTVVFDTIYNPQQTRLLREAAEAGCHTVSGLEMFVRQAAAQFALWTGLEAPMATFREVLIRDAGA